MSKQRLGDWANFSMWLGRQNGPAEAALHTQACFRGTCQDAAKYGPKLYGCGEPSQKYDYYNRSFVARAKWEMNKCLDCPTVKDTFVYYADLIVICV